jgi:hypothetical protein
MEPKEIIDDLKMQLKEVEKQGHGSVQISGLTSYLDTIEKMATQSDSYRAREYEGMLAHYAAKNQHSVEMLKAVLESGKSALHSIILINGGAVITIMGVMSNLVSKPDGKYLAGSLSLPLLKFGFGVLCGSSGFALRYLSQACYTELFNSDKKRYQIFGDIFRYVAIVVAICGFVFFGNAIYESYTVFQELLK